MAAVKQPECRQKRKNEREVRGRRAGKGIDTECEESAQADAHYATQLLLPKDALHLALRTEG